jgi:hypothetical protein
VSRKTIHFHRRRSVEATIMTDDQFALLLAVARIVRAKISREIYEAKSWDLDALNAALKPFDADHERAPVNEAAP